MTTRPVIASLLATPLFAGNVLPESPIEGPTEVSPWQFGTGVMWRNIGELSVNPNLQTGPFAGNFFSPNPATGPAGVNADRAYDDGFVNEGAATPLTGLTTFWGYQNAGQVAGGNLTYTSTGGIALAPPGIGQDDANTEIAPYIEASYLRPIGDHLVAGFGANFSFVGLGGTTVSRMPISGVTTLDSYALNGVIPPAPGYVGSFAGPGPLIGNQPTSRMTVLTPTGGTSSYLFDSSTDLYSLALGGELQWSPATNCYVGFGAGAVINHADWEAAWNAQLVDPAVNTLRTYARASSGDEFLWGLYVKGGAGYLFNDQWSVESFFRYDWNETLHGNVGPSRFEIDLSGWSLGIGLGFRY
ncbi:hypothetical protein [Haloferula sp. A504]|uniref:hypothetical protein n=1 Tax=Haloferula sp. A504 TaxID=3373601 RepID=UPI0031CA28F4|nr:hypothetical protein [Verrucomicrobiaceae bacterium E54]